MKDNYPMFIFLNNKSLDKKLLFLTPIFMRVASVWLLTIRRADFLRHFDNQQSGNFCFVTDFLRQVLMFKVNEVMGQHVRYNRASSFFCFCLKISFDFNCRVVFSRQGGLELCPHCLNS